MTTVTNRLKNYRYKILSNTVVKSVVACVLLETYTRVSKSFRFKCFVRCAPTPQCFCVGIVKLQSNRRHCEVKRENRYTKYN